MIISVKEAYELSQQKKVIFADCRFELQNHEWGRESYNKEHIPNAVYFHLEEDLSGDVNETGGRHPLPNLLKFTQRLSEKGIDQDTSVIIYDQNRAFASRLYWMMKYINHPDVYLMNGGIDEWKSEGYPTTDQSYVKPKITYGNFEPQKSIIADQSYVKNHKDQSNVALIDSRSYDRYIGKVEPIDKKAGHIPGAINSEWTNILDENKRFKAKSELNEYFQHLSDKSEIIVYCGSGVTATPNVVALWRAGFSNVRLYVGSFSDWISNEQNEIETS